MIYDLLGLIKKIFSKDNVCNKIKNENYHEVTQSYHIDEWVISFSSNYKVAKTIIFWSLSIGSCSKTDPFPVQRFTKFISCLF